MGDPPSLTELASGPTPAEAVRSRVRPLAGHPGNVPYDTSLIFALTHCVGHRVVVQTKTGSEFEGILHTPGLKNADIHIALRKARKLKGEGGPAMGQAYERLIIRAGDLIQMQAKDLPELGAVVAPAAVNQSGNTHLVLKDGAFREEAFSGDRTRTKNWDGSRLYGRQLEKWEPEGADSGLGLEEESAHETGKWDQFKANEELFGVRTSFNMEIYTAKLDASKSRFSYAEADKLAKEISKDPTIRRVLPDGQQSTIDDSGIDEETLFSAVLAPQSKPSASNQAGSATEAASFTRDKSPLLVHNGNDDLSKSRMSLKGTGRSEPIPMAKSQPKDIRREVNKVHQHLMSEKNAAYGSPLASSPLVQDPKKLDALNLYPGMPKPLSQDVKQDFMKFKVDRAANSQESQNRPIRSAKDAALFSELINFSHTFRVPAPWAAQNTSTSKSPLTRLPSGPVKVESQIPAPVTTQRPVTPVAAAFNGGSKTPGTTPRRSQAAADEANRRRNHPTGQDASSRRPHMQDVYSGQPKSVQQSQYPPLSQAQMHTHVRPHHPIIHPLPHAHPQEGIGGRSRTVVHDVVPAQSKPQVQDSFAARARVGGQDRDAGRTRAPVHENYNRRVKTPVQDIHHVRVKTPVQEVHPARVKTPVQDTYHGRTKNPVGDAYARRSRTPVQGANAGPGPSPGPGPGSGPGRDVQHEAHRSPKTPSREPSIGPSKHPVHEVWSMRNPRRLPQPAIPPNTRSVVPGGFPHPPIVPGTLAPPVGPYMVPSSIPQTGTPSSRCSPVSTGHDQDLSDSNDANAKRSLNPFAQPFVPGIPKQNEEDDEERSLPEQKEGDSPSHSDHSIDMQMSNDPSSPAAAPLSSPESQHTRQPPPPPPPRPHIGIVEPGPMIETPQVPIPPRTARSHKVQQEKVQVPVQPARDMPPPPPMVMSGPMPVMPNGMPVGPPYPGVIGPGPGPEVGRSPMPPPFYMPYPMGPVPGMPPMNQPPPPNMVGPPYPFPHPGMPMFGPVPMMSPNGPMVPHPFQMVHPHMMPPAHPPTYPHPARSTSRSRGGSKNVRRPLQRHNSAQSSNSVHSSVPSAHGGPPRG